MEVSVILENLRNLLDCPEERLNTNLKACLEHQSFVFPSNEQSSKSCSKYMQMSLELLQNEDQYQKWFENSQGCLLILGGKSKRGGQLQTSGISWLSPAATLAAKTLQGDADMNVAFFSLHPEWWICDEESSLANVIAGLLFHVLQSESMIVHEYIPQNCKHLNIRDWVCKDGKATADTIPKIVTELFKKCGLRRQLCLVVDRAEMCTGGLMPLLSWFRELVIDTNCRFKVLIVFETAFTAVSEREWDDFLAEGPQGVVYEQREWYQEKLNLR